MKTDVAYIYSRRLIQLCDLVPANRKRAGLVHSLIADYGLLDSLNVVAPQPATQSELQEFHDEDYLQCIATIEGERGVDEEEEEEEGDDVCFTDPQILEKCKEFGFELHHPLTRGSVGLFSQTSSSLCALLTGCRTTALCFMGSLNTCLWSLGRR